MSRAPTHPEAEIVPIRRGAPPEFSDQALVAAVAVGDRVALGRLFDRHHEALCRFVSRLVHGRADVVEDIVQSTFLASWSAAKRFRGGGQVRSWLFGIAANLVKQNVRSDARKRNALNLVRDTPRSRVKHPKEIAETQELLQRLGPAVAALPHNLRVAFIMCDVEDVAATEAARALGVASGTMWRRVHEARKELRNMLGDGDEN